MFQQIALKKYGDSIKNKSTNRANNNNQIIWINVSVL